ncbi:DUF305 domain-containing protein [Rhizorhapis sp. SPR117]|jgi:uncharacterized protein (DUF305 family)|uniref:DUF305 domain-containing protein n=1 Tax=Rhizorhapis sp. SPR117 TaxID=2912611 RepID=UPI001F2B6715
MCKMAACAVLVLPALALPACGSDRAGNQCRNTADQGAAGDAMSHDMGPYFHAEMEMKERLLGAVGTDAGDNWVRKMIEHQRGGVELSKIILRLNPSGRFATMAQRSIDIQAREIADLQQLVANGKPDEQGAFRYQLSVAKMHDAMMAIECADLSETWMRKMVEHHRGAVAMSDVLLHGQDSSAVIRRKAEGMKRDQQKEVRMLERILRGGPMEMPQ